MSQVMRPDGAYETPIFRMAGDASVIVEFGDVVDLAICNAVIAFDDYLQRLSIAGVIETTPTIRSVLVRFDPLEIAPAMLRARLSNLLHEKDWYAASTPTGRKRWRLPVCYGGTCGPDLAEMASSLGVSEAVVADTHAAEVQQVLMVGFAPGFLYTGILPQMFSLPRLASAKPAVPPGSISVALRQSTICSTVIPTGWRTIGRTLFSNFDPTRDPAFLVQAGDEIVFDRITESEFTGLNDCPSAKFALSKPELIS